MSNTVPQPGPAPGGAMPPVPPPAPPAGATPPGQGGATPPTPQPTPVPPPPPPAPAPAPPADPQQLGQAGLDALRAERDRVAQLERELAQIREAGMSELERATSRANRAEQALETARAQQTAAEQARDDEIRRAAVRSVAVMGDGERFRVGDDALFLVDLSAIPVAGGAADSKKVEAAVKSAVEAAKSSGRGYWLTQGPSATPGPTGSQFGGPNPTRGDRLTAENIAIAASPTLQRATGRRYQPMPPMPVPQPGPPAGQQ